MTTFPERATASPSPPAQPIAAIDIGTNTIRLLVARPEGDAPGSLRLAPLANRTATVRLGQGVERTGRLDPERIARAVATVEEFRALADGFGSRPIFVAATSAVRDAANGAELGERIAATSGLEMQIIGGEREAALTFAGATLGQPLDGTGLVADLGGGSLELIVARDGRPLSTRSLQLGSGRLTERWVGSDPPGSATVAAAIADARALLDPVAAAVPRLDRAVVVGGTATSVPILLAEPEAAPILTRDRLDRAQARLATAPAARLAADTGLDPERVRTLPAGVAILRALLEAFALDHAAIGGGGIREGLILEWARGG